MNIKYAYIFIIYMYIISGAIEIMKFLLLSYIYSWYSSWVLLTTVCYPRDPPPFSRLQVSWEIYPHICRIGLNINAHGTNWIVHGINIIQANHHVPYVFILHIGQKNWVIGLFQIHMSQEIIWMCKHNNFSKF